MAVLEIFSHPEYRRYKASIFSKAAFVQLICIILSFVPPFFVVYRSQGFWQKLDTFQEQPLIKFKYNLLVIVETKNIVSGNSQYVTWSTYPNYNQLQQDYVRTPLVRAHEEDITNNGKFDVLYFELEMPLLDTEDVHGVKLVLIFDYKLFTYATFQMESMAYIEFSSAIAGATFETSGELRLTQGSPLAHQGLDIRYNNSVINGSSIYAEDYNLYDIFQNYTSRNMSTSFRHDYPVWSSGRGAGSPFIVKATVRYPIEYEILYTPGFWQLVKFSWIQYLAVLLIFLFVFNRFKIFIFQNQLVTTIVERPLKGKLS